MSFQKWIALAVTCVLECVLFFSVIPGRADALKTVEERPSVRDGQHDFDFDFGSWKTHSSRLLHPLSGSKDWADMDGLTVVKKVWVQLHIDLKQRICFGNRSHVRYSFYELF